jgi:glycosyl transferase family 25
MPTLRVTITGAEDTQHNAWQAPSEMFVLNLGRTPERMQWFRDVNSHLPNITRFAAVDGKTLDYATLIQQRIFDEPIFLRTGSLGVALSNRRLWDTAATKASLTTLFEDDAIIHKDFATIAPSLIAELPSDWDYVLWGWNFDAPMCFDILREVPCLSRFSQSDMRKGWTAIRGDTVRPTLYRLHYGFGLPAYSVSPAGAAKLRARAFPIKPFLYRVPRHGVEIENLTFDCVMSSLYNGLNAYVCVPPLVLTTHDRESSTLEDAQPPQRFRRIRRIKQLMLGNTPLGPDETGFRPVLQPGYVGGREYTRKHAHYLYRKGDKVGAVRKYLSHFLIRE